VLSSIGRRKLEKAVAHPQDPKKKNNKRPHTFQVSYTIRIQTTIPKSFFSFPQTHSCSSGLRVNPRNCRENKETALQTFKRYNFHTTTSTVPSVENIAMPHNHKSVHGNLLLRDIISVDRDDTWDGGDVDLSFDWNETDEESAIRQVGVERITHTSHSSSSTRSSSSSSSSSSSVVISSIHGTNVMVKDRHILQTNVVDGDFKRRIDPEGNTEQLQSSITESSTRSPSSRSSIFSRHSSRQTSSTQRDDGRRRITYLDEESRIYPERDLFTVCTMKVFNSHNRQSLDVWMEEERSLHEMVTASRYPTVTHEGDPPVLPPDHSSSSSSPKSPTSDIACWISDWENPSRPVTTGLVSTRERHTTAPPLVSSSNNPTFDVGPNGYTPTSSAPSSLPSSPSSHGTCIPSSPTRHPQQQQQEQQQRQPYLVEQQSKKSPRTTTTAPPLRSTSWLSSFLSGGKGGGRMGKKDVIRRNSEVNPSRPPPTKTLTISTTQDSTTSSLSELEEDILDYDNNGGIPRWYRGTDVLRTSFASLASSDWTIMVVVKTKRQHQPRHDDHEDRVDTYHVHRSVLTHGRRGSEYFRRQIQEYMKEGGRIEEKGAYTILQLEDPVMANIFPYLLDFMYYSSSSSRSSKSIRRRRRGPIASPTTSSSSWEHLDRTSMHALQTLGQRFGIRELAVATGPCDV